jgi:GNAT superfamily N-acetyltransferase
MSEIVVAPATAQRFDAVEHALTGGGDGRSCQCQWWMLTSREYSDSTLPQRTELLRREVQSERPPGLVAEVDGTAAGWVRVGPRTTHPRLARTRLYGPASSEPWDDESAWTISCFSVRREFRGQGVMDALLAAAIPFARDRGARVIEAYPIDTDVSDADANDLYRGVLRTFLDAGFVETARPRPDRTIVALHLR